MQTASLSDNLKASPATTGQIDIAEVAAAMIGYGGSFAANLGKALMCADSENAAKIKATWPMEWAQYETMALGLRAQEDESPEDDGDRITLPARCANPDCSLALNHHGACRKITRAEDGIGIQYRVTDFRNAGLEAKWGKRNGVPFIYARNPKAERQHQRETYWLIDAKTFADMQKVGIVEGFDNATLLGDMFSI